MTPHTNQVVPVELTDAEIEGAFKNTNFGTTDYKAILSKGVESVAMQYHNGWTLTQILRKLGLAETGKTTHGQDKLTAKGLAYLKQRAATPQQQGEPVAWHVSYECGATKISTTRTDKVIWTREHFVTESFTEAERFTGPVNDEGDVVAPIKNKRITPLGLPSLTADASFNQGIEASAEKDAEWIKVSDQTPPNDNVVWVSDGYRVGEGNLYRGHLWNLPYGWEEAIYWKPKTIPAPPNAAIAKEKE